MIAQRLKYWLNAFLKGYGFEVRYVGRSGRWRTEWRSLGEALHQVRRMRVVPTTVIDVGAAYGSFTRRCADIFPQARYLLVEPLQEYEAPIRDLVRQLPHAHYVGAAASDQSGEIAINVHPDLVGSSVLREVESGTDVNGLPRTVPAVTIDELLRQYGATGSLLLKLDVQGAELAVLRGASAALQQAEYVLLEVSLFRFFESGPDLFDVIAFMKNSGFVVYDLVGPQYRPLDEALSQMDVAFVKEIGPFRMAHGYATPSQRAEQTQRIRLHLEKLLATARPRAF